MSRIDPIPEVGNGAANSLARVVVAGHEWTLFEEAGPLLAAMIEDIRVAKTRVWMESYIYADDATGRAVAAALAERAAAGVDVRLMVDAWGCFGVPSALFDRLRATGVQVHVFHSFSEAFRAIAFLEVLNQRNHRKLLVIDEQIAYFGGMNVVDLSGIRSTVDAKSRKLPASAGWRDVHVRVAGPRQEEIAQLCERLWKRAHRQPCDRGPRWPIKRMLESREDSFFFFGSRPGIKQRSPQKVLAPLVREAQREITLAVAYFLPMGALLRELLRARRRGVRVRVIVPGQSDVKVVQWATRHVYEFLLKRGVRIYERKDRMLHSKVMVMDGKWSVLGSCNFDARSLHLNHEFFAVVRSQQMAQALESICREEIRASVRVTAAFCRRRSYWQRFLDRAAWTARRWL